MRTPPQTRPAPARRMHAAAVAELYVGHTGLWPHLGLENILGHH